MSNSEQPSVLIIDDRDSAMPLRQELEKIYGISALYGHPDQVSATELENIDLVLVDFQLDEWYSDREGRPLTQVPPDGLAVAQVLRRHLLKEDAPPVGIALYSGNLDQLSAPLPPENREHALARLNNLEWVFPKSRDSATRPSLAQQIAALAQAMHRLPRNWVGDRAEAPLEQLASLLAIGSEDAAREVLIEDVESCAPPIHELTQWSHGLAVLRWLLHRILPYPTFVWDVHYVAARLRVTPGSLQDALQPEKPLAARLKSATYSGLLSEFFPPRWWRRAVDTFAAEITDGNPSDLELLFTALTEIAGGGLQRSNPPDHPVVCVNSNYVPIDSFEHIDNAVRVRPDDWPPYAEQAWTKVDLAKSEPRLRAIVTREDAGRL